MSNLRLISETTIASGVQVNNVTDCFSSDFDIYKVIVSSVLATGADRLDIRFINSSGSVVTGDYDNCTLELKVDSAFGEQKYTSLDYMQNISYASQTNFGGFSMYVFNPFNSSAYTFTTSAGYGGFVGDSGGTENINNKGIGVLKELSQIAGISLKHSGTTSGTTGRIKVYGLRVDS